MASSSVAVDCDIFPLPAKGSSLCQEERTRVRVGRASSVLLNQHPRAQVVGGADNDHPRTPWRANQAHPLHPAPPFILPSLGVGTEAWGWAAWLQTRLGAWAAGASQSRHP